MAVVPGAEGSDRALTEVKAVDDAYPLLGAVELEPAMPLGEALAGTGAVMAPSLADRRGLEPGDTFRIGDKDFTLSARLVTEPDDASGGLSLGPRTIVRSAALDGTGLLSPGTLFETEYRLDLPEDSDLDALAMPFVIGRIFAPTVHDRVLIRDAQAAVAEDDDNLHVGSQSQTALLLLRKKAVFRGRTG